MFLPFLFGVLQLWLGGAPFRVYSAVDTLQKKQ